MPPNNYLNTFGGPSVSPSNQSYAAYTIDASLTLVWPFEATPGDNVAADKLDITATTSGLAVLFPAANKVSVGQDILVKNVGAQTVEIRDFGGAVIGSVASGEAWYYYVTDNSFADGLWESVEFGAGTSNANAAALAGKGLVANVTKLDQNLLTDSETTGLTIDLTRKARVVQNEGGTVVWAFDPAATLGDGFFFYAINAGTGTVTLAPDGTELIDGELTKLLQPDENCIVFGDGTSFHTLGYGRVLISEITGDSINVSGTGDYVLSDTERDAQVQDFTGTLTGARTITYGNVVGYWFVYNNTSGAFTLTARCDSLDAGAVVPQGYFSIVRSNGTNMDVAFTDLGGTVTSVSEVAGETVATPNPILISGTIGLANTAVTPGIYGSASETSTITIDQKGRAVLASEQLIDIPISQVQVMTSAALAARVSDETGTGVLVFNIAPALTSPALTTPSLGVATATSINGNTIPVAADTVALLNATQTLTSKTLTSPATTNGTFTDPALAGTPTAPTAATGTDTTQIATTAFVNNSVESEVIAKAYCDVNTGTGAVTINKQRNIASITYSAPYFIVTMSSAAADANYTVQVTGVQDAAGTSIAVEYKNGVSRTTTVFHVAFWGSAPTPNLNLAIPSGMNITVFA